MQYYEELISVLRRAKLFRIALLTEWMLFNKSAYFRVT